MSFCYVIECFFNNIDYYIKEYLSKAQFSVQIVVAWINTALFEAEFNRLVQKNVQITICIMTIL